MISQVRQTAGQPNYKSQRITNRQTSADIIKQMRRAEYNSRDTSKRLVKVFKQPSKKETCRVIHNYLRNGLRYQKEPKHRQTAKEIRRYISDGYGDCKHYAVTAVGILNACGIPAWFVLVSQHWLRPTVNHAYCCALVDNQLIVIDPCRISFNSECKYFKKYNYSPFRKKAFKQWH